MGLRLVAHYFDRSEAFVVCSALEAAGVVTFMENYNQVALKPFSEIALGGFRIMVVDEDLPDALDVLREAMAHPTPCEEQLVVHHFAWAFSAFHLLQWWFFGLVIWVPMRRYSWEPILRPEL
jgi:hypothetical protein